MLGFLATTRYPARDEVLLLLSIKSGLRAKELTSLTAGRIAVGSRLPWG